MLGAVALGTVVALGSGCRRVPQVRAAGTSIPAPALRADDSRGVQLDVPRTGALVRCRLGSRDERVVVSVSEARYVVLGVPVMQQWREIARCGGATRPADSSLALRVPVDPGDPILRRAFQSWLIAAWDSAAGRWSQLERHGAARVGDSVDVAFGPIPASPGDHAADRLVVARVGPLWPASPPASATR